MQTGNNCPESEAHEIFVGLQPYTVACPRAMMVHAHHTLPADAAVMSSGRLDVVALLAKAEANERFVVKVNIDHILFECRLFL